MKSFLTVLLFLLSISLHSYEFKNFQITSKFKDELINKKKDRLMSAKEVRPGEVTSLRSASSTQKQRASIDDNELYTSLLVFLIGAYQNIGYDQTDLILDFNDSFILGNENNSGFIWEHPFGSFSVKVERQVLPNNYGNYDWIVNDTFTISIDAEKYLGDLQKDGLIEISDTALGAFIGIVFKRIYTYNHFAETYQEGLVSDYSKAFLSFQKFRENTIHELEEYEFISKEDVMVASAGAELSIPVIWALAANAEVYAQYNQLKRVTVQAMSAAESENEKLVISLEKTKGASTGASIGLQIDFFNLELNSRFYFNPNMVY